MDNKKIKDQDLWKIFQKGDDHAFGELFNRYYPVLYKYGCKICGNRDLINDTIQDFFFELWKNKTNLEPSSLKNYLLVSFRRKLTKYNTQRQSLGYVKDEDVYDQPDLKSIISDEEKMIIAQSHDEKKSVLNKAIASLSPRQQEAVFLKFYAEKSYKEIAEIMELNDRALYTLMQKAITRLRKALKNSRLKISTFFFLFF